MTSIADRISDELHHHHDSVVRPQLSFDAALMFLRKSRSTVEARRAGEILRRSVAAETETTRSAASVRDEVRERVHDLTQLVRQARSPYEVRITGAALRQAVRSASPQAAEVQEHVDLASHTETIEDRTPLRSVRVLIVEDDPNYRKLLATTLERSGAIVLTVGDVEHAIRTINEQAPHIIVSDIDLPGPSGYDLMEHVQTVLPRIPVVAISGLPQDLRNIRDAGFRLFFTKEAGVARELAEAIARIPDVSAPQLITTGLRGRSQESRDRGVPRRPDRA